MEKVSLYVPCYNAEKYIAKCLEGILSQTYLIDEILIIDDGSTDKTVEIASKYPVKIIRHGTNKGLASARNTAFKNAKNEYVAALDADCVPEPDWLEKLMENFTDNNIAGVGGKLIEKHTDTLADKWRAVHMKQNFGDKKLNTSFLFGSNNIFRKVVIQEVGYYNEKFRTNGEDADLCKKISEKGFDLVYEPEAVVFHSRMDTISSVLETYWKWLSAGVIIIDGKKLIRKIASNFIFSFNLLKADFINKNYPSLIVDAILPFYWTKIDLKRYLRL